jgi:hypothetical protein
MLQMGWLLRRLQRLRRLQWWLWRLLRLRWLRRCHASAPAYTRSAYMVLQLGNLALIRDEFLLHLIQEQLLCVFLGLLLLLHSLLLHLLCLLLRLLLLLLRLRLLLRLLNGTFHLCGVLRRHAPRLLRPHSRGRNHTLRLRKVAA